MATEADARHRMTEPGSMRTGLFIPCYVDMLFPEVGIATLELLERLGFEVGYPLGQTCCGQPMSNSGDEVNAATADIEATLVHGAQGARSLDVFFLPRA
jgi:Fe-S oxidoreductase